MGSFLPQWSVVSVSSRLACRSRRFWNSFFSALPPSYLRLLLLFLLIEPTVYFALSTVVFAPFTDCPFFYRLCFVVNVVRAFTVYFALSTVVIGPLSISLFYLPLLDPFTALFTECVLWNTTPTCLSEGSLVSIFHPYEAIEPPYRQTLQDSTEICSHTIAV